MGDLISRQAALKWCRPEEWGTPDERWRTEGEFGAMLEALPSAQQWIPVEERLPEDYADVLAWFEYYRYGDYNSMYQMHGIGSYASEYNSWLINGETGWHKLRVIAWMPLPEPYKGDES